MFKVLDSWRSKTSPVPLSANVSWHLKDKLIFKMKRYFLSSYYPWQLSQPKYQLPEALWCVKWSLLCSTNFLEGNHSKPRSEALFFMPSKKTESINSMKIIHSRSPEQSDEQIDQQNVVETNDRGSKKIQRVLIVPDENTVYKDKSFRTSTKFESCRKHFLFNLENTNKNYQ